MAEEKLYIEMGHRIHERRKELHLTQDQLAEKANVSAQMISYVENGNKAVRPENLIKISRALNVSCDYILTGNDKFLDSSILIELTNNLDIDSLNKVIELIYYLQRLK